MDTRFTNIMYVPEHEVYVHRYEGCDVFSGKNLYEPNGYLAEDWTFERILEEAISKGCPIIVKNGGKDAKWYLKGTGKPKKELMQKIEHGKTVESYKKRTLYYIKYCDF